MANVEQTYQPIFLKIGFVTQKSRYQSISASFRTPFAGMPWVE